jgi:hypothetical protein
MGVRVIRALKRIEEKIDDVLIKTSKETKESIEGLIKALEESGDVDT